MADEPKLYADLAGWFHLLTPPAEYVEEAATYERVLRESAAIPVETVLELGSGGGHNASHLKSRFELTLSDRSAEMLAVSREINPECEHLQGDMRTLRLDREFDAVFAHDAIDYMTSRQDLEAVAATAFIHARPGGAALFVPDHVRETFREGVSTGGSDDAMGNRGIRYLQWTLDPDPADEIYITDFAYMLREGDDVRVVHDRHVLGLFSVSEWVDVLGAAGFENVRHIPFSWDQDETEGNDGFVARKPAEAS